MKKVLLVLLAVCLIFAVFTACGKKDKDSGFSSEGSSIEYDMPEVDNGVIQFNPAEVPEVDFHYENPALDYSISPYINGDIPEAQLEDINTKANDLLTALINEFQTQGISVDINSETGEIMIDATVVFGGDSAVLTDDGKAILDKFVDAYSKVVYSSEFDGFIEKTVVEGHIAPVDGVTYEQGLPLSEKRANAVMDYCKSIAQNDSQTKLANSMEAVGCSNSRPVYDDSGNIDYDASRRVSFMFVINTDYVNN